MHRLRVEDCVVALRTHQHFAAWEQPKIFTEELRAGFRSLRTQQADKAA